MRLSGSQPEAVPTDDELEADQGDGPASAESFLDGQGLMTEAMAHRGWKRRLQRRWLLPLLSAALLCLSGLGAQAHGVHAPGAAIERVGAVPSSSVASISIVSHTQVSASLDARADADCPVRGRHLDHSACAGVSCHAVASGAWPVAEYQPCRSAYERLAATVGDGRSVAPLFHPPKI